MHAYEYELSLFDFLNLPFLSFLQGEENFHVFYYLLGGHDKDQLSRYALEHSGVYRYLGTKPFNRLCPADKTEQTTENLNKLVDAMNFLAFKEEVSYITRNSYQK